MKKKFLSQKTRMQFLFSLGLFLLCVNLGWGQNPAVAVDVATIGDYRSLYSGNWSDAGTWQVRTGVNTWATASAAPTATNTVYIQAGHTVTVDVASVSCYSLHINSSSNEVGGTGVLAMGANTVNVSGKIRSYTGAADISTADGTFVGTDGANFYGRMITSTIAVVGDPSLGVLKFVGGTRTIIFIGEWGSSSGTPPSAEFALDSNATGTIATTTKFSALTFSGGIVNTGNLRISLTDNCTIKTGARLISSKSGITAGAVFLSLTGITNNTVTIDSGGILELKGATPGVDCATFNNNGTVIYSGGGKTLLAGPTNIYTTYSTLILSGTGIKTLSTNTTVNGSLSLQGTANLALGTFTLTYGTNATLEYAKTVAHNVSVEWPVTNGPTNVTISNSNASEVNATLSMKSITGVLTVSDGSTLNTNGFVTLKSTAAKTATIAPIGTGVINGNVTYSRNLPTSNWYLVSSPVAGETYDNAYVTANSLSINSTNNAIGSYTTVDNTWSYMQTGGGGTFNNGQGYSVKRNASGDISFTGTINTDDVSLAVSNAGTGFNLIGNPFTAYLNSASFLTDNTSSLTSQTIWVFNQGSGNYETKVTDAAFVLAPGQGFFVRSSNGTNLNIAESYQASTGGTFQKVARTEVKLMMNDGTSDRFAKMYYLDNAKKGFDNGFDGETFGGIENTVDVFTNLVENNEGKKFQVQSLPIAEMETMIVTVGVKAAAGKEITFTAEALNLPGDIKVFLEDRLTNTSTRLDEANAFYKVTLNDALNGTGRFFLHTKASGVLSTDDLALSNTSVYATANNTLRVVGLPSGNATLKVFSVLGKQVVQTSFSSTGSYDISLPKLATGMYIVQLETAAGKLNKKIVLE
jgi:hypothetical protein